MKAAHLITVIATGLLGCSLGQVGAPEPTRCELAAKHVATCLGEATDITSVTGACDVQQAAQAEQVLSTPCSDLAPEGQRSTTSLSNLFCNLLPFLCSSNNEGEKRYYRINDCWNSPHNGGSFCYDLVKIDMSSFCTEMMERAEWQRPHFNHAECLQQEGGRCRLARVCEPFQHKGQCIVQVNHHHDEPRCQHHSDPYYDPDPLHYGPCAPHQVFTSDDMCSTPHTVGHHGSCNDHITGNPRPDLCHWSLSCMKTPEVIVDYEKPGVSWVRVWRCFP